MLDSTTPAGGATEARAGAPPSPATRLLLRLSGAPAWALRRAAQMLGVAGRASSQSVYSRVLGEDIPHPAAALELGVANIDDVRACYRLLLGREADPDGLANWDEFLRNRPMSAKELGRAFMETPEYQRGRLKETVQWGCWLLIPFAETIYPADGEYEPYVYHSLMETLEPGSTFLDVGANVGLFSILASRRQIRTIAVEPQHLNARLILMNAYANGAVVELNPVAVSEKIGYALMGTSTATTNAAIGLTLDALMSEVVPVSTLDTIIAEDVKVDVLKIDVEGFEHKALLGGLKMLERSRPVMFTEYSPEFQRHGGSSGQAYLEFLRDLRYRFTILHRHQEPEEVSDISEIQPRWEAAMEQGITHLDLKLRPAE